MAKRPPTLHRPSKPAPRKWAKTSRASRHARGYGREWDRLRAAVLADDPFCYLCAERGVVTIARVVDHKRPKWLGGTDDRDNLGGLCNPCNLAKTASEGQAGRQAKAAPLSLDGEFKR